MKVRITILAVALVAVVFAGCLAQTNSTSSSGASGSRGRGGAGTPTYSPPPPPATSPHPSLKPPILSTTGPWVAAANDTSMHIRWIVTVSNDLQSGQGVYSHVVLSAGGVNIETPDQVGTGERDALVVGLKPNTTYSIQLLSHVSGQAVLPGSMPIKFTTSANPHALPPVPQGIVVAVDHLNVDSITVNRDAPPYDNGPGSSADVSWFVHGNGTVQSWAEYGKSTNLGTSTRVYEGIGGIVAAIDGLEHNKQYFIKVYATAGGKTVNTTLLAFHTPDYPTGGTSLSPTPTATPSQSQQQSDTPAINILSIVYPDARTLRISFTVSGKCPLTVVGQYMSEAMKVANLGTWPANPPSGPSPAWTSPASPTTQGSIDLSVPDDTVMHVRLKATSTCTAPQPTLTALSTERLVRTRDWITVDITAKGPGFGSAVTCGGYGIGIGDMTNDLEFHIHNIDSNGGSHEWILVNTTAAIAPAKAQTYVFAYTPNGPLAANSGAQVITVTPTQASVYDASKVNHDLNGWVHEREYQMLTNRVSPTVSPFWADAVNGDYTYTGAPGPLVMPVLGSNPPGSGALACGILTVVYPFTLSVPKVSQPGQSLANGDKIPVSHTCDDVAPQSPPLTIQGLPLKAKAVALIMEDMDTTPAGHVHWVWWNMPGNFIRFPNTETLPAAFNPTFVDDGAGNYPGVVGKNDAGPPTGPTNAYEKVCPPAGTVHHYMLHAYAQSNWISLDSTKTATDLRAALAAPGMTLAQSDIYVEYH